jgi:hypothetical protein
MPRVGIKYITTEWYSNTNGNAKIENGLLPSKVPRKNHFMNPMMALNAAVKKRSHI